mgnify:CR=1 FL=1
MYLYVTSLSLPYKEIYSSFFEKQEQPEIGGAWNLVLSHLTDKLTDDAAASLSYLVFDGLDTLHTPLAELLIAWVNYILQKAVSNMKG